jgi:Fe2+ or Zn2+ uptake regulation protein
MPLPQTEIPGRLQAQLAERGIRMTDQKGDSQRDRDCDKHLDASQILSRAQKVDASVDRGTVYRTLVAEAPGTD